MNSAVEFQNVSAAYRESRVLDDISLSIGRGEMVGLIGPNGAGKTTLLRTLAGIHPPSAGSIELFGKEVGRLSARERARLLAVVPQEFQVPAPFTVEEFVMVGRTATLERWRGPSPRDMEAVERAMIYTDVVELRARPITGLSGGEKQRAVVAMALAQDPGLIVMDEATSHLDLNHRLEIMQIVERFNQERNITVVVTGHDLNVAAEFCGRLVLLDRGRVVADGAPCDVLTEEILRRVYRCEVRVHHDATGRVSVVPARRLSPPHSGRGMKVHVIAGGGSGAEMLRQLCLCEYTVTCGVLNGGDSDARTAAALGVPVAMEKPFAPIGRESLHTAKHMAAEADIVIVCEVPFGPGNVANLEIAEKALAEKRKVFVIDRQIENRDFSSSREATSRVVALIERGAIRGGSVSDVVASLTSALNPDIAVARGEGAAADTPTRRS